MNVVRLDRSRYGEASAVLARAFQDDPAWSWLFPDPDRRRDVMPWLFRLGFEMSTADVWGAEEPIVGAARWLPPGRPAVRVAPTLRALALTPLRLGATTMPFLAYGRAVEVMRAQAAAGPHWYLAGIGVEPSRQREGIGGELLRPGLRAARQAGVPAVLLTNTERNISFYRRHGFEVVLEGATPEDGPHAWAMVAHP
ncbi:MAG TPA: GNAT family N-acetyltransferase [Gaiellaceae bacterium]|nr:GNAT family N-acetyltransferase [Gaiellaceae bacterium]